MCACAFLHLCVGILQYLCLTLIAGEKQPPRAGERSSQESDLCWPFPHQHEGRRFVTRHKVAVVVVMFWRTVLLLLEWRRVCHYFKGCMLCFPWSTGLSAMFNLLHTDQSKLQSQALLVTLWKCSCGWCWRRKVSIPAGNFHIFSEDLPSSAVMTLTPGNSIWMNLP